MEMTAEEAALATSRMADIVDAPQMQPALRLVQAELGRQEETSFEQKIDPDGEPWPERKHEYPWPMLVKTGFLYLSVGDQVHDAMITATELELPANSTVLPTYAEAQDQGTDKIDPRPFLGFGQETIASAVEIGIEEINRQLLEAVG